MYQIYRLYFVGEKNIKMSQVSIPNIYFSVVHFNSGDDGVYLFFCSFKNQTFLLNFILHFGYNSVFKERKETQALEQQSPFLLGIVLAVCSSIQKKLQLHALVDMRFWSSRVNN